ncbi:MAG: hypothetical protein E2O68_05015 [Deltaproteobacteria bacterium]|nr:MAG: hypothetical protein E2O68_05015 [Deltaproteobacteria bacterium]
MSQITKKSIFLDILFTILTFGLFNLWVQLRQMIDANEILGKDDFSAFKVLLFSLLTLGLYFSWHEYSMTRTLQYKVYGDNDWVKPLWTAVATFFGLWFLVDSYQQSLLNAYIDRAGPRKGH